MLGRWSAGKERRERGEGWEDKEARVSFSLEVMAAAVEERRGWRKG